MIHVYSYQWSSWSDVVRRLAKNCSPRPQNNYIQKGISRRIVSHASLRMLNFLASVMREFYEEIDRKNRIFGRKTDILRKCVAGCAILLNIYGKKDCFDVSSYNWAHKHHFIVRKTKKTYLSDCENSHEKTTNWYILRAQNLFLFANVRVNLSKERSVFIKMFIKMFISKEFDC